MNDMIEITDIVPSLNEDTCVIILHSETKWVKCNKNRVINSKMTNRDQIFNHFIGDKHII